MKFLFTLLFLIIGLQVYAQVDYTVKLKAHYSEGGVTLIWSQKDPASISLALKNGYFVKRVTLEENGVVFSGDQIKNNTIILADSIKPYNPSEWDQLIAQGNEYAHLAKSLLFNDKLDSLPLNLDQIKQKQTAENMRQFYMLSLALKDTDVAEGLGIYFRDTSMNLNSKYLYSVHIHDGTETGIYEPGYYLLDPNEQLETGISNITLIPRDSACIVKSVISEMSDNYFAYNIYVSTDSINFTKSNTAPILITKSEDNYSYFTSRLLDNTTKHYFYIRGVMISGEEGTPSSIKSVVGKPDPIEVPMSMNPPIAGLESDAIITWTMPVNFEADIQGFNILRRFSKSDQQDTINTTTVSTQERRFSDPAPMAVNYYSVEVIDKYGYSYISNEIIFQPSDSIPPAIPTNLEGTCDDSGMVTLTWNANKESDINGYRVYMSNLIDGEYSQMTTKVIQDTSYSYRLDLETLQEEIFFTVRAGDYRENMSEMTTPLAVRIPDIVPPSAPSLYRLEALPEGVVAQWKVSQSKDVIGHKVERRLKGSSQWEVIYAMKGTSGNGKAGNEGAPTASSTQNISGDLYEIPMTPFNSCLDNGTLLDADYEYRVVAFDAGKNESYSDVMVVRPLPQMLIGKIINFAIVMRDKNANGSQFQLALNAQQGIITGEQVAVLCWDYPDRKPGMLGFQIYRSLNGAPFRAFKLIEPNSVNTFYQDVNDSPQLQTSKAIDKTEYAYLDIDMIKNKKVKYKIIAVYKNGATSNFSDEKFVNIFK